MPEKTRLIQTLYGHTGAVFALTVLQNGFLSSASYDGTIKLWGLDNEGNLFINDFLLKYLIKIPKSTKDLHLLNNY